MPGIATHFEVLKITLEELRSPASGPALNQIAKVMDDNPAYAHLGVIGPAMRTSCVADSVGRDDAPARQLPHRLDGSAADPRRGKGPARHLEADRDIICELDSILNDEDFDQLKDFSDRGDFDRVQDLTSNFGDIVASSSPTRRRQSPIRSAIASRPNVVHSIKDRSGASDRYVADSRSAPLKHSGLFVKKLLARANTSGIRATSPMPMALWWVTRQRMRCSLCQLHSGWSVTHAVVAAAHW